MSAKPINSLNHIHGPQVKNPWFRRRRSDSDAKQTVCALCLL